MGTSTALARHFSPSLPSQTLRLAFPAMCCLRLVLFFCGIVLCSSATQLRWQEVCGSHASQSKLGAVLDALGDSSRWTPSLLAHNEQLIAIFDSWAADFDLFTSKHASDSRDERLMSFAQNLLLIHEHNRDPTRTHHTGCNQFTGMSFKEFSHRYLHSARSHRRQLDPSFSKDNDEDGNRPQQKLKASASSHLQHNRIRRASSQGTEPGSSQHSIRRKLRLSSPLSRRLLQQAANDTFVVNYTSALNASAVPNVTSSTRSNASRTISYQSSVNLSVPSNNQSTPIPLSTSSSSSSSSPATQDSPPSPLHSPSLDPTASSPHPSTRLVPPSPSLAPFPPLAVDWIAAGKVTRIHAQTNCGSCWAYTAVDALESLFLILHDLHASQVPDFGLSVQQLLSCCNQASPLLNSQGQPWLSDGCTGGLTQEGLSFAALHALTTNSFWPISSSTSSPSSSSTSSSSSTTSCDLDKIASIDSAPGLGIKLNASLGSSIKLSGVNLVAPSFNEKGMMKAVARQPTVVHFDVQADFFAYAGGIYDGKVSPLPSSLSPSL